MSVAHYFFTEFYTAECLTVPLTDLVKCRWVSGSRKVMLFHYLSLVQPPSPHMQLVVHSIDSHQYILYFSIFYTSVFWNWLQSVFSCSMLFIYAMGNYMDKNSTSLVWLLGCGTCKISFFFFWVFFWFLPSFCLFSFGCAGSLLLYSGCL